jgi:hypothetical protein
MYARSTLSRTVVLRLRYFLRAFRRWCVVHGPSTGDTRARLEICPLRSTRAGAQRSFGAESDFVEEGQRRRVRRLTQARGDGLGSSAGYELKYTCRCSGSGSLYARRAAEVRAARSEQHRSRERSDSCVLYGGDGFAHPAQRKQM